MSRGLKKKKNQKKKKKQKNKPKLSFDTLVTG